MQVETETMEKFTTRVVNAASQLAAIGKPQSDDIVCHVLLMGVRRPDYEHAVHQLLHDEKMLQSVSRTVDYLVVAGAMVEEQAAAIKKAEQARDNMRCAFSACIDKEEPRHQKEDEMKGTTKRRDDRKIVCFVCGEKGHRASKCPERHDEKAEEEPSALLAGGYYKQEYEEKDSDTTSKYTFTF